MKKLSFLIATALCIMACSGGSDEQPDGPGNGNGNGGGGSTPNPVSFSNPIVGKQLPDSCGRRKLLFVCYPTG